MKNLSQNEFIARCVEKYGNKFDYSKTIYSNKRKKVIITCPIHGDVNVYPLDFLNSSNGCPICGKEYAKFCHKGGKAEFIKKAEEKFGNIYSFPSEYENNKKGILIHCNICGRDFSKRPNDFLTSKTGGCPHYRIKKRDEISFDEFLKKAREKHGERYRYVSFDGKKEINEKIAIICPLHGKFEMSIKNHLEGKGCRFDGSIKNKDKIDKEKKLFQEKSNDMYGNEFSINFDEYIGPSDSITMKCNKCGYEFKRPPRTHLSKHIGCIKCNAKINGEKNTKSTEDFINQCVKKYGDEYSFDKTVYKKSNKKVIIKHNTCGRYFSIEANSFLEGHGCPYHLTNHSKGECEIREYISDILKNTEILSNDRNTLNGDELDIFIPSLKIAIEYDGLFWHCEALKGKNYHLDKTKKCEEKGIKLIHIFEDEWTNDRQKCKFLIKRLLNLQKNHIFAEECEITHINEEDEKLFMEKNSFNKLIHSDIRIGLKYREKIVSIMSFSCKGNGKHELLFCSDKSDTKVDGSGKRMIEYFIEKYCPSSIISYDDRRCSFNDFYNECGFVKNGFTGPKYFYVVKNKRMNEDELKKISNLPKVVNKIYDCGGIRYEWKR